MLALAAAIVGAVFVVLALVHTISATTGLLVGVLCILLSMILTATMPYLRNGPPA